MSLKLILAPDSRLKKSAMKVVKFDENLEIFSNELTRIMNEKGGIGIASIQVSDSESFNHYEINENQRKQPRIAIMAVDEVYPIINPEILEKSEETASMEEGCLSIPNATGLITRPIKIKAKYQDLKGNEIIKDLEGLEAICYQHELDHLDGILFPDRMESAIKKALFWKSYERLKNQFR